MKPRLKLAQINSIKDLSPHMRRIVFTGESLKEFPAGYESAHIKVIIPKAGELAPSLELSAEHKKRMRSYTVRAFDQMRYLLTVDFAVNDHKGLVADWALQAKVGDYAVIGGPGPIKYTDLNADWHLFAGDLTALPAIAATLEKLPADAVGYAFIQVPSISDRQLINVPDNVEVRWLENTDIRHNILLEHVAKVDWLPGEPQIFVAGEASQIKAIQQFVKKKKGYQKSKAYISGYWKADASISEVIDR